MITEINIQGFQSHVNTTIKLCDGLNVITGATDSGKTAILRAIRWVALGEPAGDAFVNKAVGEALVTIITDTGYIVTKTRKGNKTSYGITAPDNSTAFYEKAEIPEEVKEILGITESTFGDFTATLNFAYQLDAPFLLSEPPSAGAKVLGKLAGTEIVDMGIKTSAQEKYRLTHERAAAKKESTALEVQLKEYQGLEFVKENLDVCDILISRVDKKLDKHKSLTAWKEAHEQLQTKLKAVESTLEKFLILPELEEDIRHIEKAQQRYDTLLSLYSRHSTLSKVLFDLTISLQKYKSLSEASTAITELDKAEARHVKLKNLLTLYNAAQNKSNECDDVLQQTAGVGKAAELLNGVTIKNARLSALSLILNNHNKAHSALKIADKVISSLLSTDIAGQRLTALDRQYARHSVLSKLQAQASAASSSHKQCTSNLSKAVTGLGFADMELKEFWDTLAVCPLCERNIH